MRKTRSDLQIGSLVSAGLVLGVGLGGFVLHQIVQWHNIARRSPRM